MPGFDRITFGPEIRGGNQTFEFPPGYVLAAGGSVQVHSGPDAYSAPPDHLL